MSDPSPHTLRISRRFLLSIYAIVPIGLCLPLLDQWLLGGSIQRALPYHPRDLAFFTLIFNIPHIIASELILFDREYVREYRSHLLIGLFLAVVVLETLFFTLPPGGFPVFIMAITTYHVFAQQIGITRSLLPAAGLEFTVWKWCAVPIAIVTYLGAYPLLRGYGEWLPPIAFGLCVPLTLACALVLRRSTTRLATVYILGNQAIMLAMMPLAMNGYAFFALLMPRVVHDVTAYAFYVAHDANRNRLEPHNVIYRRLRFTGLPVWLLGPLLSIAIAWALRNAIGPVAGLHAIGIASAFHYYMEGVTWRRGTLHRRQITFV